MHSRSNTLLIVALLIAVIGWRLQDFFGVGMASQDQVDFSTALGAEHGLWQEVLGHAQATGRLYFLLTKFIDLLSATHATELLVQIANLAVFAAIPWLVAWIVVPDRRDQVVFLLAYWALCALRWDLTTPAAFPLVLTVPLLVVGAAAAVARSHARSPTRLKLGAYGGLAFAAFFQYEPGTLVATILLCWFIHSRVADRGQRRQLYIATGLALGLYAVAYMTWRAIYPSTYDATTAFNLAPLAIVRVLTVFALGALPLPPHVMPNVTFGDLTIGEQVLPYPGFGMRSLVTELGWMDVIIATVAGSLLWFMLVHRDEPSRRPRSDTTTLVGVIGLGLVLLVAANLLPALSRKYQLLAAGGWAAAYLTSYYALFGWVVLLTGVSRLVTPDWARIGTIAAFSAGFLYASASNHFVGKQVRANFAKWEAVDGLAACQGQLASYDSFAMPAASYGVFGQRGDWSGYWRDWTRSALGSPLEILPNAQSKTGSPSTQVKPVLDDRGELKAVVGHDVSRGFVIYRMNRPNYVWLRHAGGLNGSRAGELVIVEHAEISRCQRGYRIVALKASRPIDSVDVFWQLPNTYIRSDSVDIFPLSMLADADVTRAVQAIYLGYLRRPADPGGLQFWSDRIRRSGGRTFDVVRSFSGWPDWAEAMRRKSKFDELIVEAYRILLGRDPRPDEIQRLLHFESDSRYRGLVPWLVFADALDSRDSVFLNRLALAQYYTDNVHTKLGWRPDLWEKSAKSISDDPASVQRAIAGLHD
jgi:hypothetical protein